MLDDSGSMAWDYMPDWGYLSDTSDDGVRNASINQVYYDPNTTYTPPPNAAGGSYSNSPGLTNAYKDGFLDTTATNITTYTSPSGSFPYYTRFTVTTQTGAGAAVCDTGDQLVTSGSHAGQCRDCYGSYCYNSYYTPTPSCPSGYSYSSSSGTCTASSYKYFFTYTTGSGNTRHYVGQTGDCALLSTANQAVCDDSAATQQNVANWFSYYRTRILMAKSGLMSAFSSLDPTIRFGFGSIDGGSSGNGNYSSLPSSRYSYTDNLNGGSNYIAKVQPFGDGSTSSTQKAQFWNWLVNASVSGGTPLRQALNAIGQYYMTDQPWQTSSSNTEQLACRQAYSILTTDGFANGPDPSGVGDVDGSAGATITGPNSQSYAYSPVQPYTDSGNIGTSTTTTTYDPELDCPNRYSLGSDGLCHRNGHSDRSPTPSCDNGDAYSSSTGKCTHTETSTGTTYSDTLADVAMKYWNSDLRTGMANEVPTSTEDSAFWQHMATFTVGLGFTPVYSDNTTPIPVDQVFAWANGGTAIQNFVWPEPDYGNNRGSGGTLANIADLAHAAVNGHGGFYSATSPQAFSSGIADALKRVATRVGTGASLASNSTKLETGTVTYQAVYYTGTWRGDLKAFNVDPDSGAIASTASWTASNALPAAGSRNIWTYNSSGASGAKFVEFKLPSSLSTAEQTALGSTSTIQQNVISYLRGDSSKEENKTGGTFRTREAVLGDIVDSQPVYVGAPDANLYIGKTFTGSSAYATFAATQATRTAAIWVAANDGMLHAFRASDGVELFAYMPEATILDGIADLSDPNYGGNSVPHEYFNDGEITAADVYLDSTQGWRSVVVGTTGRGLSKAVYALDVTNPASPTLLWERRSGDGLSGSSYIGQITGKPVIAQVADGSWAVLIGNGYNSTQGKAALLQFAISDGSLNVHTTTDSSTDNGLAPPAVWMASATNGISTTAYAGDLKGHVWSFDLSSGTSTGSLLFTAESSGSAAQPITAGMLAGKDPDTGNVWLFFGTGRYLTQSELEDESTQTWWGIIVQAGAGQPGTLVTNLSNGRDALRQRSIVAEQEVDTDTESLGARAISTDNPDDMAGYSGWYIDLTSPTSGAQGERMVTPNQFQGSLLLGTTRIPESSDPCNPSGSGWIMAISPFTGAAPGSTFFDTNGDGDFDDDDMITDADGNKYVVAGVGFSSVPNNPIFVGNTMLVSFDNATTSSIGTAGNPNALDRLSWRELFGQSQ
ncbi:pilus assembly protein PilY [Solimonas sp. C16B3]|uniref:Pilus assembly protein PilY n=2 Tax=Solimonas marina TaxID=2714601 RepID=A0A970B9B9_9GAMM|nr:pilus assembly protein PilY [Solimonas marina]